MGRSPCRSDVSKVGVRHQLPQSRTSGPGDTLQHQGSTRCYVISTGYAHLHARMQLPGQPSFKF